MRLRYVGFFREVFNDALRVAQALCMQGVPQSAKMKIVPTGLQKVSNRCLSQRWTTDVLHALELRYFGFESAEQCPANAITGRKGFA